MTENRTRTAPPGRAGKTPAEAWCFGAGIACVALVLAVFAAPMLAGKVYTYDDLGNLHLPLRHFYAGCLKSGNAFDWHPGLYCGFYLQGEGQAGMYHPLHFVLYRVLPLSAAFNIELFLSYPAALAGMYLLLRRWGLSRAAALFGAAAFAFSGFLFLHFVQMHAVAVIAHIPWLLYFQHTLLTTQRRGAFVAIALLTASQALLGHPHFLFLSLIIEGVYALVVWGGVRRLAALAGAKVLGALAGAVQILATLDALANSSRLQAPAFQAGMYSLEKLNLLQLAAPYLFKARVAATGDLNTHEYGIYCGAAVLVLALTAVVTLRSGGRRRRLVITALALAAAGLVLAFGRHGPLFGVYSRIPVLSLFRAPVRFVLLAHFGMAAAAAFGFDALLETSRSARKASWKMLVGPIIVAALALGASAAVYLQPVARIAAGRANILLGLGIAVAAAAFAAAASRGRAFALVLLTVLAAADLGAYGLSYVYSRPSQRIDDFRPSLPIAAEASYYRIRVVPSYTNAPTMAGYRLSNGFSSLPPRTYLDRRTIPGLRVSSVMYLAVDPAMVEGDRARQGQSWDLHRVEAPLPRVRMVSQCITAEDLNAALAEIDPAETAIAERPVALEPSAPGGARIVEDAPGEVVIRTVAPARQLLVFAERFHKGWRAETDGVAAPIIRVYGDFMGCVVDPGEHETRFVFRPASLRAGRTISLATLAAIALLAVALAVGKRVHR